MPYMPQEIKELRTPIRVYKKIKSYKNGAPMITKELINDAIVFCNFKTYGGTEKQVNNLLVILDTARVTTYFRPDITSDCIIEVIETGKFYEIKNEPENIGLGSQYMQFIVERIDGNV